MTGLLETGMHRRVTGSVTPSAGKSAALRRAALLRAATLALTVAVALATGLGAPAPAAAQSSSDIYTVTGIPIDATGADASQARESALVQGRIKAADEVLRRFTLYADWPRLPEVDAVTADAMVTGIGVANERTSGTRYLGEVTARLDPGRVRSFLRQSGVRFTESQAAPVLLLPVLDTPGVRVLFDEPNPWRAAWESIGLSNSLVPIRLALGDLEDFAAIDAGTAIGADWAAVEAIAGRYGVDQVLVAHAKADEGASFDVTLYRVTPRGTEETTRSFQGATVEDASATAAQEIRNSMIANWKTQNAVAFGLEQTFPASVEFASLGEWAAIRKRLESVSIVQSYDVVALSARGAELKIRVAGPIEALAANLSQRQVRLIDEGGYWTMALAPSAAPAPAPSLADPATLEPAPASAPTSTQPQAGASGLPEDEAIADRLTRQNAGSPAP